MTATTKTDWYIATLDINNNIVESTYTPPR